MEIESPQVSRRFRFSPRTLFILLTILAFCFYWLALPAINARRFIKAIEDKEYAYADKMFIDLEHEFIVKLMKDRPVKDLYASRRAQTAKEFIFGFCEVTLTDYGLGGTDERGVDISIEGYMYEIGVTSRGLQEPRPYKPIPGWFGGS